MTTSSRLLGDFLTPRPPEPVEPDGRYPIAGVRGFGRGLIFRDSISGAETRYRTLTRLTAGDVVYSKVKAFEGALAVVPTEGAGRFVSPEFPVFSLSDDVDPCYLRHALGWEGFVRELRATSNGIGARRERVSPVTLLGMRLPMPRLREQRRIAAYLDRLAMLPRDEKGADLDAALASAVRDLPWTRSVGEVMALDVLEVPVVPELAYRLVGVLSHGRGILDRGPILGAITKYPTWNQVGSGQVILSRLKAFEGAVAVVPEHLDGAVASREFPTFTIRAGVEPALVRAVLRTPAFSKAMQAASSGVGARRERISAEAFLRLPFPDGTRGQLRTVSLLGDAAESARSLSSRRAGLMSSLLLAARNEVFTAMR